MKKLVWFIMLISIMFCVVGCEKNNNYKAQEQEKVEDSRHFVALVTDMGNVFDKSFNEGSWNGVEEFAKKADYRYEYFKTVLDMEESRKESIDEALNAGADVLVCPGSMFQNIVYDLQTKKPELEILLIDVEPTDKKGNVKLEKNVHSIIYKEEQVGYLAGYVAIKEGYRKLGFLGGMDVRAVRAYGYGFVQGAEVAAKELDLEKESVSIEYMYGGGFEPTVEVTESMKKWYESGTEVIFSCGGGILYSVIEAASEDKDRKIIGVDGDQAGESEQIIFSAMKGLTKSVSNALKEYKDNNNKWPKSVAGKTVKLGIESDCVGLSATEGSWRMSNVTIDDYKKLYNEMKKDTPEIESEELPELEYVKLNMEK